MKASTDTRLMNRAGKVFWMGLEVAESENVSSDERVSELSWIGLESTVGLRINSGVGSGMILGLGSGRSSEKSEAVS